MPSIDFPWTQDGSVQCLFLSFCFFYWHSGTARSSVKRKVGLDLKTHDFHYFMDRITICSRWTRHWPFFSTVIAMLSFSLQGTPFNRNRISAFFQVNFFFWAFLKISKNNGRSASCRTLLQVFPFDYCLSSTQHRSISEEKAATLNQDHTILHAGKWGGVYRPVGSHPIMGREKLHDKISKPEFCSCW